MSKKVKCTDCHNFMYWSVPKEVHEKNYKYAKYCLEVAKESFICIKTGNVKYKYDQYCNKFLEKTEIDLETRSCRKKEIDKLERMLKEYKESRGIEN